MNVCKRENKLASTGVTLPISAPCYVFTFFEKREEGIYKKKKKQKDDTEENLYKVRKVSSNCLEKRSHQSTAGPLQNAFYFPLWYLRPVSNVELYTCRI